MVEMFGPCAGLKWVQAGEWVINWRMDQEESNQVRGHFPPPFARRS
jgi:hypothetical protein